MARKALVVGIDYYKSQRPLFGCVNDALSVAGVLSRNGDGSVNFGVMELTAKGPRSRVSRADLKKQIMQLFADDSDIALLYFAGHGYIEQSGGYIVASDATRGEEGIPLANVITWANESPARNKIIILDSCFAGVAGDLTPGTALLSEGLVILAAATKDQYASENNNSGVFTTLFVDALNGAAANLVGDVTPSSVYAHIEQSLGPWEQRPVFKTNVKSLVTLRRVPPPISPEELRRIAKLFPSAGFEFKLNPSFEPTSPKPNRANTEKFAILQRYRSVNLVKPVDAPHMWHAAMKSKSCKLTPLGEHFRKLAERGRI